MGFRGYRSSTVGPNPSSIRLLDSLDPTTRKGVARGFSSSGLPNLPSKIPAIAPVSSSPPVPANDERSSPASKNSSPADPASPITAPSPTLSNSTPVASRIAADLTSASPSVRARGLDAFLGLARSGPSESFLPAYLALLRQPDSSTRCVDELPALLEANIITALDVVSGLIDAPEHLRKPVVAKLGATAIEPLFAMLGDSDAQFALPWLLDLAGVPGIAEQLVPAAAPLALAGDRAAVAILAALREKDRWNYEKALRTFVGPEQVKLIQDLCDSDEDSNEEQDDEESEPAPAPATPSAVVLDSPDQPLPPRSTRGRKSEFFRPPATPSSDEGTPDFRTRISSLAAPRNATPSDAGTPGGLPPFPGSAIRSVRGSLAPLPTGATPSSAGTPFRIDQRKFRLSMSFRDEMMDPHGFEEGEGDVWQGTSLADELGAAGWDGFMEEVSQRRESTRCVVWLLIMLLKRRFLLATTAANKAGGRAYCRPRFRAA